MFAEIFSIHMMATTLITILQHSAEHTHTLTRGICSNRPNPTPLMVGKGDRQEVAFIKNQDIFMCKVHLQGVWWFTNVMGP